MMRRAALVVQLALPAIFLELVARLGEVPPTLAESAGRLLFFAAALGLGWLGRPFLSADYADYADVAGARQRRPSAVVAEGRWGGKWAGNLRHLWTQPAAALPPVALATLVIGLGAGALYGLGGSTLAAWAFALILWAATFWLADLLARGLPWPAMLPVAGLCGGLVGAAVTLLEQLEGGFAEEEFFGALAALILAAGWALSYLAHRALARRFEAPRSRSRIGVRRRWLVPALGLALAGMSWASLGAYRASFFPAPPPFAGVSADVPFLCEQLPAAATSYAGEAVFARVLELVEAHPEQRVPELGMLALGSGDVAWAAAFREGLLAEAAALAFSSPANSVKYGQYEAAQRVYYYSRVRAAFPALFSAADDAAIRAWFAAVNRRALTVEWVDWLYAAAFGELPRGPYANQETGAGLLALLETTGLGDPALANANRAYLAAAERGWAGRWRNNDDTYYYQSEWITNALYQSLGAGELPREQVRRSFEWLLLQLPPDGRPLGYNFPFAISPDATLYLGAGLLDDPRLLWAAGLVASSPARVYPYSAAQPGADAPLTMAGEAPTEGSCLLFGDTGTPTAPGPIGPDKLVLREGWAPGDAYLLLNLRFTGWHRYKASNTVTLIVQGETLVADQIEGRSFSWLPRGRSAFRDKRIPRENLSGLVVSRSGISAVRHLLAGLDSSWAQDPPPFARVERFAAGAPCDTSVTTLDGWRGWNQRRTIRFCPGEPTVIADEATGPAGAAAAVMWNLAAPAPLDGDRVRLGANAELALLTLDSANIRGERPTPEGFERVAVAGSGPRLRTVAVLLAGPWRGAAVTLDDGERPLLRIVAPDGRAVELEPFGAP